MRTRAKRATGTNKSRHNSGSFHSQVLHLGRRKNYTQLYFMVLIEWIWLCVLAYRIQAASRSSLLEHCIRLMSCNETSLQQLHIDVVSYYNSNTQHIRVKTYKSWYWNLHWYPVSGHAECLVTHLSLHCHHSRLTLSHAHLQHIW